MKEYSDTYAEKTGSYNGTFKINEVSSAYNFTVLSIDCIFAKGELKANSGVNFQTFIDQHAKINNF